MAEETKKTKILLVEDDTFLIELLVPELRSAGFEVAFARNVEEGVQKFLEVKPELILLDILLSDKSGLEMLRQIRRDPDGKNTKVIVLSNVSDDEHMREAKRLGALEYLVKVDFSIQEIIGKIRAALEG